MALMKQMIVEAKIDLLDMQLAQNKIKVSDALSQFENIQIMWRGDHIELKMLARLSKLYVQNGQYRDAFANIEKCCTGLSR